MFRPLPRDSSMTKSNPLGTCCHTQNYQIRINESLRKTSQNRPNGTAESIFKIATLRPVEQAVNLMFTRLDAKGE